MEWSMEQQQALFDLKHYNELKAKYIYFDNMLLKCMELDTYVDMLERVKMLQAKMVGIERRLSCVSRVSRKLLLGRYLHGKSWQELADELSYSVDHCRGKLLRRAVEEYLKC